MAFSNKYEYIKKTFKTSPIFNVIKENEQSLTATRVSKYPKRGILRLLIPQAYVVINNTIENNPSIVVRPDSLAIFMVILLLGGVSVELLMDRSLYPREYPPEFIYALAIFYVGLLIIEMFNTHKLVRKLLNQKKL